jgi:hypothetical protein
MSCQVHDMDNWAEALGEMYCNARITHKGQQFIVVDMQEDIATVMPICDMREIFLTPLNIRITDSLYSVPAVATIKVEYNDLIHHKYDNQFIADLLETVDMLEDDNVQIHSKAVAFIAYVMRKMDGYTGIYDPYEEPVCTCMEVCDGL